MLKEKFQRIKKSGYIESFAKNGKHFSVGSLVELNSNQMETVNRFVGVHWIDFSSWNFHYLMNFFHSHLNNKINFGKQHHWISNTDLPSNNTPKYHYETIRQIDLKAYSI